MQILIMGRKIMIHLNNTIHQIITIIIKMIIIDIMKILIIKLIIMQKLVEI